MHRKDHGLENGFEQAVNFSAPYGAFTATSPVERPEESFFHPVKAIEDLLKSQEEICKRLDLLLNQMLLERTFSDTFVPIGLTRAYQADYQGRKFLYMRANAAVTLVYAGGTVALTPGVWKNISPPRGTLFTVQAGDDTNPAIVTVRLCDVFMG